MITVLDNGNYKLASTKRDTKILYLDDMTFAWLGLPDIGEVLIVSQHIPARGDYWLNKGHYRLYSVEDEPHLADLQHLELEYGEGMWQGYLLLSGLPSEQKKRVKIVPTSETITKNLHFSVHKKPAGRIMRTVEART